MKKLIFCALALGLTACGDEADLYLTEVPAEVIGGCEVVRAGDSVFVDCEDGTAVTVQLRERRSSWGRLQSCSLKVRELDLNEEN